MKQKYLFWFVIIVFTILPIMIEVNLNEESERVSTFVWSIYLIPNILIMIKYPRWKTIIFAASFYSFLKYSTYFLDEGLIINSEVLVLILGSFVNGAILLTVSYFRLRYNKLLEEVRKLVIVDSLTGLYNRRYFDLYLEKTIPLSQRIKSPLILIMLDIDHFKNVNDDNGHQCGDMALKHISAVIKNNMRKGDAYVRFGGEEFALILPNTTLDDGRILAERIRAAVEQADFTYNNERLHLTISLGVSLYAGEKVEKFIQKADQALYRAKEEGRNQVVVFG